MAKKKTTKKRATKKARQGALPSKKDILSFLEDAGYESDRRMIARHFGIKGAERTALRALLKEMEADGSIKRPTGKRIKATGALPPVMPIDIVEVDDDGDLLCEAVGDPEDVGGVFIRISAKKAEKVKPVPGVGDRVLARLKPAGDNSYDADILKAIGKGAHKFLAVFRKKRGGGGSADPVERKTKGEFIIERADDGDAKDGDLVWLETKNAHGYGPRRARVRSIAGHIDDHNAFSTIALANHAIPTEFPPEVQKEANSRKLPSLGDRTDLRNTPLFTIDPADAKDHDDACFAEPDSDPKNPGGHRVIVAIADVSYFVRPGDALDKEAVKRGNSTYLPDRVVPMLPERLSNDLCSLREGEDRPCLAVEMIITSGGVKKSHRFIRAIMRSAAKLSYEEAQAIEDGAKANAEITASVKNLYSAYRARTTERAKRAPLDLDLPERKIILDKNGDVEKVVKRERFDAHKVIEEFMILANVAAAETLERARMNFVYRIHDQPDPDKLDDIRKYLETLDYKVTKGGSVRPANFNQLLKIAEERDEKQMVSEVVLRSQRQAIYSTENLGHFGLNLPRYAHFTSPIRRYADLIVHRALVSACKLGEGGQSKKEAVILADIAEDISDLERRSMAAERDASDRYLTAYLETRVGVTFPARIRGVTKFGLFVMLDESGADGFIPMRTIGNEYFRFNDGDHAIVGDRTGGVYRLGQEVEVKLVEAIPLTGALRFEMLSDPLPAQKKQKKKPAKKASYNSNRKTKKGDGAYPRERKKKRKRKSNAKPRKRS
ncbi:MAG: ribonuclease R [Marinicaulis sp.]|nr:ribonuclease R [Marinicaulis sp.]